jgi:hypothetical protein
MGWFMKSAREAKPLAQHPEKTALKIAEKILAVQRSTAAKLNAQAKKMGRTKVIFLLGALLIGFAAYLVYIMVNALF